MAKTRQALGRGLGALIPQVPPPQPHEHPTEVDLDRLTPNRFQPRTVIDEPKLEDLARSIEGSGIIQPIVVRPLDGGTFEIVAGERRWRAAQRAGLLRVPVVVRDVPDDKLLELALIENVQRENLNPIEEAEAYHRLINDYHLTQEQVAAAVG
jgi:ParB family chromosome partitioning protein